MQVHLHSYLISVPDGCQINLLIVTQIVKKCLELYVIRRVITTFTTACHWNSCQSQLNPVYTITSSFPPDHTAGRASLVWNPTVHWCAHISPSLVPVLSHMNPLHTHTIAVISVSVLFYPLVLFIALFCTFLPRPCCVSSIA